MKKQPENNLLNKRLLSYSEDPGDETWDRIAAAIVREPGSTIPWRTIVISLLIFLAGTTGYLVFKTSDATETSNKFTTEASVKPGTNDLQKDEPKKKPIQQPDQSSGNKEMIQPEQDSARKALITAVKDNKKIEKSLQVSSNKVYTQSTKVNLAGLNQDTTNVARRTSNVAPPDTTLIARRTSNVLLSSLKPDSIVETIIIKKDTSDTPTIIDKKKKKSFHPVVYFSLSPSLAFQKIIPNTADDVSVIRLNSKGIYSSDRLGLAVDAGFRWMMSMKFEGYAGFSYYQQNSTIDYSVASSTTAQGEGAGKYVLTPGSDSRTFSYEMKNVGVSAGAFYLLQGTRLRHKAGLGLQYQVGLLSNQNSTYDNSSSSYLNYQLMYRIEFSFSERMDLFIQPSFTHILFSKENLAEPFSIVPYRVGVGLGFIYHF